MTHLIPCQTSADGMVIRNLPIQQRIELHVHSAVIAWQSQMIEKIEGGAA